MYEVSVEDAFSAAHALRGYAGDCERLHGHNWRVELTVEARALDAVGMAADFRELKAALGEAVRPLDHRNLNEDVAAFREANATTERLARLVAEQVAPKLPAGVRVARVRVWESAGASAAFFPGPEEA